MGTWRVLSDESFPPFLAVHHEERIGVVDDRGALSALCVVRMIELVRLRIEGNGIKAERRRSLIAVPGENRAFVKLDTRSLGEISHWPCSSQPGDDERLDPRKRLETSPHSSFDRILRQRLQELSSSAARPADRRADASTCYQ